MSKYIITFQILSSFFNFWHLGEKMLNFSTVNVLIMNTNPMKERKEHESLEILL